MKIAVGLLLALSIGVVCRVTGIPIPAPPVIVGALLVVAMTSGYLLVDTFASHRPNKHKAMCGGPSGDAQSTGSKGNV